MQPHSGSRIFGLDLMRAVAIIIVMICHSDDLIDAFWSTGLGESGLDGVDLFFVLSGYLIGGILLQLCLSTDLPWWLKLADFWQRRWLRTLPNYFLFLAVNLVMLYAGLSTGILNVNVLAYFVFLQNFWVPLDLFFWESWSLAVEEWFYLLFPLLLFAVIGLVKGVRIGFLVAVLVMIIIPTCLRPGAVEVIDTPFLLSVWVRKVVIYRLDTIGFGVLIAWLAHYWPRMLYARRIELFVIGLCALVLAIMLRTGINLTYMGTWFFTISGGGMALMLPALASWHRTGKWGNGVVFLSKISYALYLVHMPVRLLMIPLERDKSMVLTALIYVSYWAISIALASIVYRYWERPFMALRDPLSARIRRLNSSS